MHSSKVRFIFYFCCGRIIEEESESVKIEPLLLRYRNIILEKPV
jgi:hypothetical protein